MTHSRQGSEAPWGWGLNRVGATEPPHAEGPQRGEGWEWSIHPGVDRGTQVGMLGQRERLGRAPESSAQMTLKEISKSAKLHSTPGTLEIGRASCRERVSSPV